MGEKATTLDKKSTFKEIKEWFRVNDKNLPGTLSNSFKTYHDVRGFVASNIYQIDALGKKASRSKMAIASKLNLLELYNEIIECQQKKP